LDTNGRGKEILVSIFLLIGVVRNPSFLKMFLVILTSHQNVPFVVVSLAQK
jgi:hypothetical protein